MTRSQRRSHVYVWLVLGPAILVGLSTALLSRPAVPIQAELPASLTGADGGASNGPPVTEPRP